MNLSIVLELPIDSTESNSTSKPDDCSQTGSDTENSKYVWCNLESHNVIFETNLVTAKKVTLLKPAVKKNFRQAKKICDSICGDLYFPSTLEENNEVAAIIKERDIYDLLLRISDIEQEWVWKDTDHKEVLHFTNWAGTQPNSGEHYAAMARNGKWWDKKEKHLVSYILCQLI